MCYNGFSVVLTCFLTLGLVFQHRLAVFLAGHRFEDVPGVRRHLVKKSAKGQVVHIGKDHKEPSSRIRTKLDRTPHEVRCQLTILSFPCPLGAIFEAWGFGVAIKICILCLQYHLNNTIVKIWLLKYYFQNSPAPNTARLAESILLCLSGQNVQTKCFQEIN